MPFSRAAALLGVVDLAGVPVGDHVPDLEPPAAVVGAEGLPRVGLPVARVDATLQLLAMMMMLLLLMMMTMMMMLMMMMMMLMMMMLMMMMMAMTMIVPISVLGHRSTSSG